MADWQGKSLSVPTWATGSVSTIQTGTQAISAWATQALVIAEQAAVWGHSKSNVTTIALRAIIQGLTQLRSDLQHMGFYVSGDWDQSSWQKLGGGYGSYANRMFARLRDRQDPNYPNLSPSTTCLGVFFYAAVQDVAELPQLERFLNQLQGLLGVPPQPSVEGLPVPTDLTVVYGTESLPTMFWHSDCRAGDTHARISWTLAGNTVGFEPSGFLVNVSTQEGGLPLSLSFPDPQSSSDPPETFERPVLFEGAQYVRWGDEALTVPASATVWTDPQGYPVTLAPGYWGQSFLVSGTRRTFQVGDRWGVTLPLKDLPKQPVADRSSRPSTILEGSVGPCWATVRTLGPGDLPSCAINIEADGTVSAVLAGARQSSPSPAVSLRAPPKASGTIEQAVENGLTVALVLMVLMGWYKTEQSMAGCRLWLESSLGQTIDQWLATPQSLETFRQALWSHSRRTSERLWSRFIDGFGQPEHVQQGLASYAETLNTAKWLGLTMAQLLSSPDPLEGLAAHMAQIPNPERLVWSLLDTDPSKIAYQQPVLFRWDGSTLEGGLLDPFTVTPAVQAAAFAILAGRASEPPDRFGWQSVTAAPMLGWATEALDLGLDFARAGLKANQGTDALMTRQIATLEHKVAQLDLLIQQLDALLGYMDRFGFPAGATVQVLLVEAAGVEGVISEFQAAGHPPSDPQSAYTAGACMVLGGVPTAGLDLIRGML